MIHINRILCPVDLSDSSLAALARAIRLGRWYHAAVEVLHVTPSGAVSPALEPLGQFITGALSAAAVPADAVVIDSVIVEGDPVREIVDAARNRGADLVVIGAHGRTGFRRRVLGSVTDAVMRQAPCPVLSVPVGAQGPHGTGGAPFRHILCPVDFSPASLRGLLYGLALAEEAKGMVSLLNVLELLPQGVTYPGALAWAQHAQAHNEEEIREQLRAAVPDEARDWCETQVLLSVGEPSREIVNTAAHVGADLIVMGAQGRGAVEAFLLGSTSAVVAREALCPVLIVRGTYEASPRTPAADRRSEMPIS